MGIRRKILLGFISIGSLLLLSGIISTLELVRFNRSTYKLLEQNKANIELSKQMLDAVQEQNTTLLMSITDSTYSNYESELMASRAMFDKALTMAAVDFSDSPNLEQLRQANSAYNKVVENVSDSITVEWFSRVYKTSYSNLTSTIKEFMMETQQQIVMYTADLERNAYRATMVGIIALAAGILLIILFYYMINKFILSPILSMQNSLHRHIEMHTQFDVSIVAKDEIMTLRNDIVRVVEKSKK